MSELIELLRTPEKTEPVVDRLTDLLGTPLRQRLQWQPMFDTRTKKGCPCQFLLQEVFTLPAPLRSNVGRMLERAGITSSQNQRAAYLGLTVTHVCGDAPARARMPHVRWGFAMEPGSSYSFDKGAKKVLEPLQAELGAERFPTVAAWPVPNLGTFQICFLGRRMELDEVARHTPAEIIDLAARDLETLHRLLTAA